MQKFWLVFIARPWSPLGMLWIYCCFLFKDALTYPVWKDFYVWYLAVSIAMPARWPVSFLLAFNSPGILLLETPFLNVNFPFMWKKNLIFLLQSLVCLFLISLCLSFTGCYVSESLSPMPLPYKDYSIHLQQPTSLLWVYWANEVV